MNLNLFRFISDVMSYRCRKNTLINSNHYKFLSIVFSIINILKKSLYKVKYLMYQNHYNRPRCYVINYQVVKYFRFENCCFREKKVKIPIFAIKDLNTSISPCALLLKKIVILTHPYTQTLTGYPAFIFRDAIFFHQNDSKG